MGFLETMVKEIRRDVEAKARKNPIEISRAVRGRSLLRAIERAPHVPLVAELKWASPSHGRIRESGDARVLARDMVEGGAVGLSVLAEQRYFGGSPMTVRTVRSAVEVPVLYKSIIVHEYQVYEAASVGADAVLLMVSVLGDQTKRFVDLSRQLGMETLVEVGEEGEVEIGVSSCADMVGINNRDMRTLRVDLNRTADLINLIPEEHTVISESGISGPEDVRKVIEWGADAVLVGSAIMKSRDVKGKVRSLVMAR
ncbi:MAG: indole-3-glycerol-phosphate synthase [Candidatus Hadarchaeales archaeon]